MRVRSGKRRGLTALRTHLRSNGMLPPGGDLAAHMHGRLQLQFVHVLARHGDRTSVSKFTDVLPPPETPLCNPARVPLQRLRKFRVNKVRGWGGGGVLVLLYCAGVGCDVGEEARCAS